MATMHAPVSDAYARAYARRCGLIAVKSRRLRGTADNRGGFQVLDRRNWIVAGEKLDLSADSVLEVCRRYAAHLR